MPETSKLVSARAEELRAPREKLADLKARMGMREALMEAMQDGAQLAPHTGRRTNDARSSPQAD